MGLIKPWMRGCSICHGRQGVKLTRSQEVSLQGAQCPSALRQLKVEWNPAAPTYHTSDNDAKAAKQKSSKYTLLHSSYTPTCEAEQEDKKDQ